MRDEADHLTPSELLHLLWIGAHVPQASQALAHLYERCDGCETPGRIWEEIGEDLSEAHFDDASLGGVTWAILFYGHSGLTKALAHLLGRCPECWRLAEGLFERRLAEGQALDYDALHRRVERFLDDRRYAVERARREAPELLARLLEQPAERRQLLVKNSARYHHPPLVEALCEESQRHAAASAEEAHRLALLALEAASRIDPLIYGERVPHDLVALAHAYVANALRVANRFRAAKAELVRAEEALGRGSGLETVTAEVECLKASWLMATGDLTSARRLLSRAALVFKEVRDDLWLARVLVKHALVCREGGEADEACRLLAEAEPLLDGRDRRLLLCTWHNRLNALVDLGRFEEAGLLLAEVQVLSEDLGSDFDRLRLDWVEAKILAGTGRLFPAEAAYTRLRDEFLALELPLDAGLVTLELCLVLLQLGRAQEVTRLVEKNQSVFRELGVAGVPLAACSVLAREAVGQTLT